MCLDIHEFGSRSWLLARIMKTHPGKDGKVRVVTITMKGRDLPTSCKQVGSLG